MADDDLDTGMTQMASDASSRRSRRRLPQFIDGGTAFGGAYSFPGSSASTPKPKTLNRPPSDEAAKKEGFTQVGGGKAISFKEWEAKLNRIMPFLGELSYKSQIAAAQGVVRYMRKKLAEGIDPGPSPMTIALRGADPRPRTELQARRDAGAALATLGAHIIVGRPPQKRVGRRKATATNPGSPGVFAKGFGPAVIKFENEHWDKIAYVVEHGRIWKPPEAVKRALITKAQTHGFKLEEGMGSGGYWVLPPRPFLHLFTGPEANKIVRQVAEKALKGQLDQEMAAWKEEYIDAMDHRSGTTIEDMADYLSDDGGSEDWTDLIEFKPRRRR